MRITAVQVTIVNAGMHNTMTFDLPQQQAIVSAVPDIEAARRRMSRALLDFESDPLDIANVRFLKTRFVE